jgi:hypothetical protein
MKPSTFALYYKTLSTHKYPFSRNQASVSTGSPYQIVCGEEIFTKGEFFKMLRGVYWDRNIGPVLKQNTHQFVGHPSI